MKTQVFKNTHSILKRIGLYGLLVVFATGCVENNIEKFTFKGEMVYTFLEKDTTYSEFTKIISKAGLRGMLSAYGSYTCLAPTNTAMKLYYKKFGAKFNIDSLTKGQIDTIARTHIVPNTYLTADFSDGVLPNTDMNKRVIEVKFEADTINNILRISLNDSSKIISKDNKVYNGVIHGVNRVLQPSNSQLPELIERNPDLSIFYQALYVTRLSDSLRLIADKSYFPTKVFKDEYNGYNIVNPSERKYGYTAFVESNEVFKAHGINDLNDLIAQAKIWYPDATDDNPRSPNNSLNKFIAYHLVNKAIYYNKFFYTTDAVKGYTPDEFIESMLTYRLVRASMDNRRTSDKITLNLGTDNAVHVKENLSKTTINGVYHQLDGLLLYNESVERMFLNTRIRFDFTSLFPELTNNGIRGSRNLMTINNGSGDRFGFEQGYLKDVKFSKDTRLIYLAGKTGQWANFQSDEFIAMGPYDMEIRILPVPPGTYELRFGYSANGNRSYTQLYVDHKPIGIPLDLTIMLDRPQIGYIADKLTDDNGFENDKMMRNRGYMKAPTTYLYSTTPGRDASNIVRRIVGTFTFDTYSEHYLRFRSCTSDNMKQCMIDYLEFVPKSVYNPASGEPETRD